MITHTVTSPNSWQESKSTYGHPTGSMHSSSHRPCRARRPRPHTARTGVRRRAQLLITPCEATRNHNRGDVARTEPTSTRSWQNTRKGKQVALASKTVKVARR